MVAAVVEGAVGDEDVGGLDAVLFVLRLMRRQHD